MCRIQPQSLSARVNLGEAVNMADWSFLAIENNTSSNAAESSSYRRQLESTSNLQLQQQSDKSLARDLDTGELASTVSGEENVFWPDVASVRSFSRTERLRYLQLYNSQSLCPFRCFRWS